MRRPGVGPTSSQAFRGPRHSAGSRPPFQRHARTTAVYPGHVETGHDRIARTRDAKEHEFSDTITSPEPYVFRRVSLKVTEAAGRCTSAGGVARRRRSAWCRVPVLLDWIDRIGRPARKLSTDTASTRLSVSVKGSKGRCRMGCAGSTRGSPPARAAARVVEGEPTAGATWPGQWIRGQ